MKALYKLTMKRTCSTFPELDLVCQQPFLPPSFLSFKFQFQCYFAFQYDSSFYYSLSPPPPFQTKINIKTPFPLLKAIIIILLLPFSFIFFTIIIIIISIIALLFSPPCDHTPHPPPKGFTSLDRNMVPQFQVTEETETSDTQCIVWLQHFRNGQWCRKLITYCHLFHQRCVDVWLVNVAACPTCWTPAQLNAWARGLWQVSQERGI